MKKRFKIIWIALLVCVLALVRFFETQLFYDPLLEFYKEAYLHNTIPQFNTGKLLLHVFFRFNVNTAISLIILYVTFFDKNILKFSFYLYVLFFLICFSLFTFIVLNIDDGHFLVLFYVRRFLIHPIFVLILMPAFYYYRRRNPKLLQEEL